MFLPSVATRRDGNEGTQPRPFVTVRVGDRSLTPLAPTTSVAHEKKNDRSECGTPIPTRRGAAGPQSEPRWDSAARGISRPTVTRQSSRPPNGASHAASRDSMEQHASPTSPHRPAVGAAGATSHYRPAVDLTEDHHVRIVPHYALDGAVTPNSLNGSSTAATTTRWPAPNRGLSAPVPQLLATDITSFLTQELDRVQAHEGSAGRFRVCREAFDKVIEAFPTYRVVLATVKRGYEEHVAHLEDEKRHFAALESVVEEEHKRNMQSRDEVRNALAAERAATEHHRGLLLTVQHEADVREERLRSELAAVKLELQDTHKLLLMERAARREADDDTATYRHIYENLKSKWQEAKREVETYRAEAAEAIQELHRDKGIAEGTLLQAKQRFETERQELHAEIQRLQERVLTPEQLDQIHRENQEVRRDLRNMQTKLGWMSRELERRAEHEPPIQWSDIDTELGRLRASGVTSHDIARRLHYQMERARASEHLATQRLQELASFADVIGSGPVLAALEPVAVGDIGPLSAEAHPWAPAAWCNPALIRDDAFVPPSLHQHYAVRQWCVAAMIVSAACRLPSLAVGLERVCRPHFDTRDTAVFFAVLVHRLSTTFAGDPFIRFAMALLQGSRNAAVHCHQLLLETRAASGVWYALECALRGSRLASGTLPREALLASLSAAFPLKAGRELLGLRQALYDHIDGRFTAPGRSFVAARPSEGATDPAASAGGGGGAGHSGPVTTPWNDTAAIRYSELFWSTAGDKASPVLVELAVQYEADVRRGEQALENHLDVATQSLGRFEGGPREAHDALTAWARSSSFAKEVILGTAPSSTDDPVQQSPAAAEPAAAPPQQGRIRGRRSTREAIASAIERTLKDLQTTGDTSGGLRGPKLATVLLSTLDESEVGPVVVRRRPPTQSSGCGSWFAALLSGIPGTSPYCIDALLPPVGAGAGEPTLAPNDIGHHDADSAMNSSPPLSVSRLFDKAVALAPISGTFLLRCAVGRYVVPPLVLQSVEGAFTRGVHMAAMLLYDEQPKNKNAQSRDLGASSSPKAAASSPQMSAQGSRRAASPGSR